MVHYTYGSPGSDADNLNRLDAIKDDNSGLPGDTLASYTYIGLGQMVIEDLEEPEVKLDYFGGTSGTYVGFDRFDRIVDQRWYDYAASEDRDRFKYGYDRASNRTWKENTVSKNLETPVYLDEFYSYDSVNRLINMDRGQLNTGKTAIQGTPSREENWMLDPLGNWSNYLQKTDGATDLNQDRAVNCANEITDISGTIGTAWPTPSYEKNGNMTTLPQPNDLTGSYNCTWDAWNRLVKVTYGATTVASYVYDGVMRRVTKSIDSTVRRFFYSAQWRVLEERLDTFIDPECHFIWGPLYVDHLILRDRDSSGPNGTLDERIYALQDVNWNTTCLSDTFGTAAERYCYAPYGSLAVFAGTYDDQGQTGYDWKYNFTGRELDSDTALYYFRHRNYSMQLASFLSRDRNDYVDTMNLYLSLRNRPTILVDPYGGKSKSAVAGTVKVILKAAELASGKKLPPKTLLGCGASIELSIRFKFKCPKSGKLRVVAACNESDTLFSGLFGSRTVGPPRK